MANREILVTMIDQETEKKTTWTWKDLGLKG